MSDYPLPDIPKFLEKVVPFNTLDRDVILHVVKQMQIAFYPRGERIIGVGEKPGEFLHVIQTGSVLVTIPDENGEDILVDIRAEGETFGAISLLKGREALFNITADEDLIAYLVPVQTIRELLAAHDAFNKHFDSSLARTFRYVRKSAEERRSLYTEANRLKMDMFLTGKKVSDLMTADVLTCSRTTTVREAAGKMKSRRVGSIVVLEESGTPVGIMTDADLRSKILADGKSYETPVAQVMNSSLRTIRSDAFTFDALLDMSRYDASHLVVTRKGQLAGIVSEHDFQLEIGSSPIGVIADIRKAASIDDVVALNAKIDNVLEMVMRRSGSVKPMVALISELNDRVTRRVINIIEKNMVSDGLGGPPVPYAWMAMGSEGRKEQTLLSDQDNGLVYEDVPDDENEKVKQWFLEFAGRVVDALVLYGIPRCNGGVMAVNRDWCNRLGDWMAIFEDWMLEPTPESLRLATIFFDFRPLHVKWEKAGLLRNELVRTAPRRKRFIASLAKNALHNRPPLGFMRQFVVEKSGEHKNTLNLKLRGLTPVVDAARVMALDLGVPHTNTMTRLSHIRENNIVDQEFYSEITEAYDFINFLRISHHMRAFSSGRVMNNFVDPALLNHMQRKMLKESFAVVSRFQDLLAARYQTRNIQGA